MELTMMECNAMYTNLEPSQPLSPEPFPDEFVDSLNVGQLSRSEKAGKLLEHLDGLQSEDAESYDWFSNEKSIDISLFDNLSSSSPTKFEYTNNAAAKNIHSYSSNVNSSTPIKSELDDHQQLSQLLRNNKSVYNDMQPSTLTTLTVLDDSLYTECPITFSAKPIDNDTNEMEIASYPFDTSSVAYLATDVNRNWLKNEALTPPESPKDEELLKMISEIEPDALEQLVLNNSVEDSVSVAELENCDSPAPISEYSCTCTSPTSSSVNDPEWSPSSSLNDPEWSPPSSVKPTRKSGSKATTLKRKSISKPHKKPDIENRKQRKKEQNKSAATRYRLKKKAEYEEMKKELVKLADKNAKLRSQFDDINREIRYLKSLMRDVYRKKGLIK